MPSTIYAQSTVLTPDETDSVQNQNLSEVVVTSLGIKKEKRSLAYATQSVNAQQLTEVKTLNLAAAIDGKVAGVSISGGGQGLGSAPTVVLRGARSLQGKNQPIIVVDGVRVDNVTPFTGQGYNVFGAGATNGTTLNAGDGLSLINPDDIATIDVLKGATGAALYGGEAANGVIMITTKRAKEGTRIDVSSTNMFTNAMYQPDMQFTYGDSLNNWAYDQSQNAYKAKGKLNPNYLNDFFQTGFSTTNSVTVSTGKKDFQLFGSYANNTSTGIIPNNKLERNSGNLRVTTSAFDGKLDIDAKVNISKQTTKGSSTIGLYFNPLVAMYLFPRSENFSPYQNYEGYSPVRNINLQHWYSVKNAPGAAQAEQDAKIGYADDAGFGIQNPFWTQNKTLTEDSRDRIISSLALNFHITDHLTFGLRGIYDKTDYRADKKMYAGTVSLLSKTTGRYYRNTSIQQSYYSDAMLTYTNKFANKVSLTAMIGGAFSQITSNGEFFDSEPVDLSLTNTFTLAALPAGTIKEDTYYDRQIGGAFFSVSASYKDMVYLDVTGRNDWSSTLPQNKNAFFYPSVGLSFVLSDIFGFKSRTLDFMKLRFSYAQVGNDAPPFINNPRPLLDRTGTLVKNTIAPFDELKPEISNNWEVGVEADLFGRALNVGLSFYNTNTLNQLFRMPASPASGYTYYYINAGKVQNQGFEAVIEYTPIGLTRTSTSQLKWTGYVNLSKNWNEVLELTPGLSFFTVTESGNNGFGSYVQQGGSIGDIYVKKLKKDAQGRTVLNASGAPQAEESSTNNIDGYYKVGNPNNQWMIGFGNTFSLYGFSLNFLIDFRLGGEVVSITQSEMDKRGTSKVAGDAMANGGVVKGNFVDNAGQAVSSIDAKKYYGAVAGAGGILDQYVYDASNIRLRQLALSYTLPQRIFQKIFIKGITVSLIGRNLFFLYRPAPFDTQVVGTPSGALPGVDIFSLPTARELGFSVKIQL